MKITTEDKKNKNTQAAEAAKHIKNQIKVAQAARQIHL